ncbi:MAG: hypothetical protein M3526_03395, partial [Actinomycetota bacterium]|nr:hypothetical protein [Actinomycetota bacterium]
MADLGSLLGAAGIGGAIGQAVVRLELDTAKYQAELKTAQASTVAGTNSMSSGVSKFSTFAQTAFLGVGVAAVAGAAVAINAAADLNEQINKTKEVFEGSAASVIAFSETTASSLGISQTAALEAAGSFGQILDAAGLAEAATADMSIALVGLAADLASFNNLDPTEALTKLQSGLAGQARPLREVGVFLSAARVEAEAYGSGIAVVGEELTDAQKIQARYNIIMQDTAKAQGDFARTLEGSLPNQLRVLKAELTDTAAAAGQALLPIALELAKALLGVVESLKPLLDLMGKLGPVVRIAGEAFAILLSPANAVISLLRQGVPVTDEMVRAIGDAALTVEDFTGALDTG